MVRNRKLILLGSGSIPLGVAALATMFEGENTNPLDGLFTAHPQNGDDFALVQDEI